MKKICLVLSLSAMIHGFINGEPLQPERYVVDSIQAVIMGYQTTDIFTELVTLSDCGRPTLFGQILSLQEHIDQCCYLIDARRLRAVMTEDQIDMVLASLQQAYGLTSEGMEEVIKGLGYTLAEGRKLIGRMNTINSLLDLRVSGSILVQRADIEAYCEEHPAHHDGRYVLQRAVVPFEADKEKQKAELHNVSLTYDTGELEQYWSQPFTVSWSDIAQEKSSIHTMPAGSILVTGETSEGFELYRLVESQQPVLKTLDERYDEIVEILKKPQEEKNLTAYRESLQNKLVIEYL